MPDEKSLKPITDQLLEWYQIHRRALPWRKTRDPYAVWVSEVMLHQTRVATVASYYQRFLERFPTLAALAQAPLDDVLKAWEGLGYYARARNLHLAAQRIATEHKGQIPDTWEALRALPGIGDYTAGAILSIAYGKNYPAVDGNVRRVLCRLFKITEDASSPPVKRQLAQIASDLLPSGRAGEFNQALMDLGATICTPREPNCTTCPLEQFCQARQLGLQKMLPIRAPRRRTPHYEIAAAVIWRDRGSPEFLIAQRPQEGLLGGLWEFPGGKREPGETLVECLKREIREELGFQIEVGEPLTVVQHAYTHFCITMHVFHGYPVNGQPRAIGVADWRWITLDQVKLFAFSAADHKIIAALLEKCGN